MKPTLLRSISNALAEQFPLLSRIRRSFIGLLIFCILFLLIGYIGNDTITLSAKPVAYGPYANRSVATYEDAVIQLNGQLTLSHPTVLQKLLLPNIDIGLDFFTLLFMAIVSIIVIRIVPKLQNQHLFRKDISNSIRLLGYLIMLHAVLSGFRTIVYAPEQIDILTHKEFTSHVTFPILIVAEMYFSLVVIALARVYKKGIQLQEEQDLTV